LFSLLGTVCPCKAEIIYNYNFNDGNANVLDWVFGSGYVQNGVLVMDAKNRDPYVQFSLLVEGLGFGSGVADYNHYNLSFELMSQNFKGVGLDAFTVLFDTPVVSTFAAYTMYENWEWKTYVSPFESAILTLYQDGIWNKFSFDIDMPQNHVVISQNGKAIYDGFFGAKTNQLCSIRFSLGYLSNYDDHGLSNINKIFIDNLILSGQNANPVPIPSTLLLLGSGLLGLLGFLRKK
jgi:hypothetical protein